jgi:hypothetical protein
VYTEEYAAQQNQKLVDDVHFKLVGSVMCLLIILLSPYNMLLNTEKLTGQCTSLGYVFILTAAYEQLIYNKCIN